MVCSSVQKNGNTKYLQNDRSNQSFRDTKRECHFFRACKEGEHGVTCEICKNPTETVLYSP